MFLGHTVFVKNPMLSCKKFNVTGIVVMNNFEFFDTTMLYFSKYSHLLEHFYKVYRKVNIYAKFLYF